jgi:endonuclease YncB( thermonuclease family)
MGNLAMISCCYQYKKYKLYTVDDDDIPVFSLNGYRILGRVVDIYDGDSCTIIFEWEGKMRKFKCRCNGYDSPEMKPRLNIENRDQIIKNAKLAKERLYELTKECVEVECMKFDKYGRLLVELYTVYSKESINKKMINEGYGYEYHGGTKQTQV